MQGEGSNSDPFRGNYYYFNNGSGPRSLNLIQLMEAPDPQQDPLGQLYLNEEPGYNISYVDLLTSERSPSPVEGSTSSRWSQFSYGLSTFQGASSFGTLSSSIDLSLPSTYGPSNPIVLTSRATQHEVEDNVSMQNLLVDGRHFLLNRRAPEDDSGQMSLGGSSGFALQAQNYEQLGVATQANERGSLNRYGPLNLSSSLTEQIEIVGRNVHFRRTNDLQDYVPAWPSNVVNVQQHSQPTLHFPYDPFLNYASSSEVLFNPIPIAQPVAQGYNILQNLNPTQLNRVSMFGGFFHEINSMDRASYMTNPLDLVSLVFERGYLENRQRNINMAFSGSRSMAHVARIIAVDHQTPSSSTFPQTTWANSHVMENLIVNGSESPSHYHLMRSFHAATNQMGRVFNIGRGRDNSSQARQRVARRGARRPPPRIRLPTATERRRRFINEELIALGEQLGIIANEVEQIQVVENGLTEDTIMARLTRETYHPAGAEEHRACSICQDEYADGDLLGKLDCGHDYHFECIKQWLTMKNSCPMCRHRALAI